MRVTARASAAGRVCVYDAEQVVLFLAGQKSSTTLSRYHGIIAPSSTYGDAAHELIVLRRHHLPCLAERMAT